MSPWQAWRPNRVFSFISVCLLSQACTDPDPSGGIDIRTAGPADFATDSSASSIWVAKGFQLRLWAPGPLLSNGVSLSIDNQGVAYVSETHRRKSSDIDIRAHRDWMTEDLALQNLDDTRALHYRKLDSSLSKQNTWMEDFNQDGLRDWRDLEVQSEVVRRVWDSDQDGRADASNAFASGFNTMITGVAAGVLAVDKDIFLTVAPDLWRLHDADGNGTADRRESISHGYGIHIAYAGHDMSGLTMGPDGRVYWSIGDMGVHLVDRTGKRWSFPNEGAVMRSNPDGTGFEVFAHGLRNPQELAFDAFGNLISVDNDGDHPGEHERFVHIIEGSDSGWRINWQFGKYDRPNESYKVWMDEKLHIPYFPGQAAYLLPPLALANDGPAGLAYNPGAALGKTWEDYFFATYFTGSTARSKIQAFKLTPKGSSFALEDTTDVLVGIVGTGLAFGPDGKLFVNDWGEGWDKKPQGRIWALEYPDPDMEPLKLATQDILAAGMSNRPDSQLGELIGHADMRVRMAAQFELVARGNADLLAKVASTGSLELARLHAIWGLGQLARKDPNQSTKVLPFLTDPIPEVRAQAAKVLGDSRYLPAAEALLASLNDSTARVRFFGAEALGKLRYADAFDPLVDLLRITMDTDLHMRHAIVYALSKLADPALLVALREDPSIYVRLGAVVALRHQRSPYAAEFLGDEHPWVVTEAARAIHDDQSIPGALSALAQSLDRQDIKDEAFLRRAINANLRIGTAACAHRLAQFAASPRMDDEMRGDALWALGYWPDPPLLDRVEGSYRVLPSREAVWAQEALAKVVGSLVASGREVVLRSMVSAIGRLNFQPGEPTVWDLFEDPGQPLSIKRAALKALVMLRSPGTSEALQMALADPRQVLREDAQELVATAELSGPQKIDMLRSVLKHGTVPEQQRALGSLASISDQNVNKLLDSLMDRLLQGDINRSLELDVLAAVENSTSASSKEKKVAYESSKDPDEPLQLFSQAIFGGDPNRGLSIFYDNPAAQCIRCHRLNGQGGEVGPPLDGIGLVLDPPQLLIALVDPGARLSPGYGSVRLQLTGGREMVGVLKSESTHVLEVVVGTGEVKEIPVEEIIARTNLPSSMFPMGDVLTKSEIRDLVAFLGTLR